MSLLSTKRAVEMGYSCDKRKRRRQHRTAANHLAHSGGFFNGYSNPGSTLWEVMQWHKEQSRSI